MAGICNITDIAPRYLMKQQHRADVIDSYSTTVILDEYKNLINYSTFNVANLPSDAQITTISCSGSFNIIVDLMKMLRFVRLSENGILSIKFGKLYKCHKSMPMNKIQSRKCFDNQATLVVMVSHDRHINIKLFQNGSFQMCGCKTLIEANIVLNKILDTITTTYCIPDENNVMRCLGTFARFEVDKGDRYERTAVTKETKNLACVERFHCDTINVIFKIKYNLDRNVLARLFKEKKLDFSFEPSIHPGIIVKYPRITYITKKKEIKHPSAIIFGSGSVKISGTRSINDICEVKEFILDIIEPNMDSIINKDPDMLIDKYELKEIEDDFGDIELPDYDDDDFMN